MAPTLLARDQISGTSVVDVTDPKFGAIGDGVADDTVAIQAAIDFLEAGNGGDVFFPGFGPYKFTNLIIDTRVNTRQVNLVGEMKRYTRLDCYATSGVAITIGVSGISNSGFGGLRNLQVFGSNSTGEVEGVEIYSPGRFCKLDEIVIDAFTKGRGLFADTAILNSWGIIHITNCHQACSLEGQNASDIQNLVVENCGPTSAYTHSTIALSDPSVYLFGQAFNIGTLSIESNDAATNLELDGAVTVGTYYSESNTESATGNEISFKGQGGYLKHGIVQNGIAASAPQARYLIGFNDSTYAKVGRLTYKDPSTNPGNTMYGVDFGTSDLCEADVWLEGLESLSQQAARQQTMIPSVKRFKYNGVDYIGRMEPKTVARTLLRDYSEIPIGNLLMNRPSSANRANGYTFVNAAAGGILTREKSFFLGQGRVQKIERSTASVASCSYTISAGTMNPTSKYFFSAYLYATDWSTSKPFMRVVNGATNQGIVYNDANLTGGWIRHSEVLVLPNATASDVVFTPCEIGSATDPAWVTCGHIIDLTAFDATFGTDLANMPTHEIEKIIDISVLSDQFIEYSRQAVPVDGTYALSDKVWYHPALAGDKIGAVCTLAGTPGTFKEFGVIDA